MYLKSLPIGSAGYICNMKIEQVLGPNIVKSPKFLDILYSDVDGNLSFTSEVLPISEGKTPIGLCIAGTGFFGANEPARWMSLKYMNSMTPEIGSLTLSEGIYCGCDTWDISEYDSDIQTIDNILTTYNNGSSDGYLTADWIINTENKIPSLFDINENWNLSELGGINQYAITDIDGKNKTDKMLAIATGQDKWRTSLSLENYSEGPYAPAACCCWRYHTLGTQAGDWYLGASGEMAMIVVKRNDINTKLAAINAVYPNDCISSLANINYWTSTEFDTYKVYSVCSDTGAINASPKRLDNCHVIAMLQTDSSSWVKHYRKEDSTPVYTVTVPDSEGNMVTLVDMVPGESTLWEDYRFVMLKADDGTLYYLYGDGSKMLTFGRYLCVDIYSNTHFDFSPGDSITPTHKINLTEDEEASVYTPLAQWLMAHGVRFGTFLGY